MKSGWYRISLVKESDAFDGRIWYMNRITKDCLRYPGSDRVHFQSMSQDWPILLPSLHKIRFVSIIKMTFILGITKDFGVYLFAPTCAVNNANYISLQQLISSNEQIN